MGSALTQSFRTYLLPGFVFQGIVIGGGYATGREIAEFFLPNGALGGALGLVVTGLTWSMVLAISFAIAYQNQVFDYRGFFRLLLGRFWPAFEILALLLMMMVLAVVAAAAGEVLHELLGLPPAGGTALMLLATALLAWGGGNWLEGFSSVWSTLLYATYLLLMAWCIGLYGDDIRGSVSEAAIRDHWFRDGIRYAGYNIAVAPIVLFTVRHARSLRQAAVAGLLAGPLGLLPAACLFVAMSSGYPSIIDAPIPSFVLLQGLHAPWFTVVFQVVLLGTLVQTGLGLVHAVNERIAGTLADTGRTMPALLRPAVAIALILVAVVLAARVGLIRLVATGYGTLTVGFIVVFVIPVLTVGLRRVLADMRGG